MARKPRSDSKLKTLAQDLQLELFERVRGGMSLEDAAVWLADEWDVETNRQSLSEFYHWYSLQHRFSAMNDRAEQIKDLISKVSPDMNLERLEQAGQLLFSMEAVSGENVSDFVKLAQLKLRQDELALDRRRVSLLEQKAAKLDQVEEISKSTMTPEEKQRAIDEALGFA